MTRRPWRTSTAARLRSNGGPAAGGQHERRRVGRQGEIGVGHSCTACAVRHDSGMRTVLIVDDHDAFRESARALLEAGGFDVVGEAVDGPRAIMAVAALRPSIVLLDIQLPGPDGFVVAEQLASAPDPPLVVLISSRDAATYGRRLDTTSARGFLTKSRLSGEALAALVD